MNKTLLENLLKNEIPLDKLVLNAGIYEFYQDGERSLGVSYECNDDGDNVYIFNVFLNGEYVNVDGEYANICDCIPELLKTWNETEKIHADRFPDR